MGTLFRKLMQTSFCFLKRFNFNSKTSFQSIARSFSIVSNSQRQSVCVKNRKMSASKSLLVTTVDACDILAQLVKQLYDTLSGDSAKLKEDKSVFTIADGLVQELLKSHLFGGNKFKAIVGEEDDSNIVVSQRPFKVDDLLIPEKFYASIDQARIQLDSLSTRIDSTAFKDLTIFIDPIDGTREFYTKLGEQCSFCIGFAKEGKPFAGVVYRPYSRTKLNFFFRKMIFLKCCRRLTSPPTWAAGCPSESLRMAKLERNAVATRGVLTSNGSIRSVEIFVIFCQNHWLHCNYSPFIETLIETLNCKRVKSGGAGNKVLMLLEGKALCYIQDRGVSRWDTCAADAILAAHNGILSKLTSFLKDGSLESYEYKKTIVNLDFEPNSVNLTKYNCTQSFEPKSKATSADQLKPYSNVCGLLALPRDALLFDVPLANEGNESFGRWLPALRKAASINAPSYD